MSTAPPPLSPRETIILQLAFCYQGLADEPRSKAREKEVTSPKLTPQVGGRASEPVADEGCTEERTLEQETLASTGLDTGATGAGPSSSVAHEQPEQVLET